MPERSARRLRRVLDGSESLPPWPAGVTARRLAGDADARAIHALLSATYGEKGEKLPPFAAWWAQLSGDAEFDPDLCLLAHDSDGRLAGVALCWTGAFIKDIAVRADMRRHGLGRALLLHGFAAFRARGAAQVDLKVELANAPARALYASAGMKRVAWGG